MGLQARAEEASGAIAAVGDIVGRRWQAATTALREWRGRRAERFVEQVNVGFQQLATLEEMLVLAHRTLEDFPQRPSSPPRIPPAQVDVTRQDGVASARPAALRAFVAEAQQQDAMVQELAARVSLEGVHCEVISEVPLPAWEQDRLVDGGMDPHQLALETRTRTDTLPRTELEHLINLPNCAPLAGQIRATSEPCLRDCSRTAAAFEEADRLVPGWARGLVDRVAQQVAGVARVPASWLEEGLGPFRSRGEAVAEAGRLAGELERLVRDRREKRGLPSGELDRWIDQVARGQFDPAFAVTFSEALGVQGYVDVVDMLRLRYGLLDDQEIPEQIEPQLDVLRNTLDTALDTVARAGGDHRNPDNADLPADQRLSDGFVRELTHGWQGPGELSLSMLLSGSSPPAPIAVEIARGRATPLLSGEKGSPVLAGNAHIVGNYMEMLATDSEASTRWLWEQVDADLRNIHLVLDQLLADHGRLEPVASRDGLAEVLRQGLTDPDVRLPGGPFVAGRQLEAGHLVRERLMDITIDRVAEVGTIHDDRVYDVLASGVEANIGHIGDRVGSQWAGINANAEPPADAVVVRNFMAALLVDDDAANRSWDATLGHIQDGLRTAPPLTGDERNALRLRHLDELSAIAAVVGDGENLALDRDMAAQIDRQLSKARYIDDPKNAAIDTGSAAPVPWIRGLAQAASGLDTAFELRAGQSIGTAVFSPDIEGTILDTRTQQAEQTADAFVRMRILVVTDRLTDPDVLDGLDPDGIQALADSLRPPQGSDDNPLLSAEIPHELKDSIIADDRHLASSFARGLSELRQIR